MICSIPIGVSNRIIFFCTYSRVRQSQLGACTCYMALAHLVSLTSDSAVTSLPSLSTWLLIQFKLFRNYSLWSQLHDLALIVFPTVSFLHFVPFNVSILSSDIYIPHTWIFATYHLHTYIYVCVSVWPCLGMLDGSVASPKLWFIPCALISTERLWSLPLLYQV